MERKPSLEPDADALVRLVLGLGLAPEPPASSATCECANDEAIGDAGRKPGEWGEHLDAADANLVSVSLEAAYDRVGDHAGRKLGNVELPRGAGGDDRGSTSTTRIGFNSARSERAS